MNKYTICHLTSVHPRYDTRIFFKECTSLVKAGYNVSLIVADGKGDEIKNGVKIYGVAGASNRLYRGLCATKRVYSKALEVNADIYHLHDPELLPISAKLQKRGKFVIFDSHEDIPLQIISSKEYIPLFIRKIIAWLYVKYEAKIVKKVNAVISVSPQIVERLRQYNSGTVQITNYPIVEEVVPNTEIPERVICFAGLVSPLWMHENVVSALSLLKGITYNLAGPADLKYLQKLQKLEAWKQVNFVGKIANREVLQFIKKAVAGIALCDYVVEVGYNIGTLGNTKLFEYMRAGIPIICTDFLLWKQIIDEEQCGICVNPRNIKNIVDAINYLIANPEKAQKMGIAGQKAVKEKYNWSTQEKILLDLYNSLQA
jgi:glycosyltransferase involved in cell wall biosynthesis